MEDSLRKNYFTNRKNENRRFVEIYTRKLHDLLRTDQEINLVSEF